MTREITASVASWVIVAVTLMIAGDDQTMGMLVGLPVMVTSWAFGARGAIVAAVMCLPFSLLCLGLADGPVIARAQESGFILGHVFTAAFGLFLGYSRTLRDRLEREMTWRTETEQAMVRTEMEAKMLRADRAPGSRRTRRVRGLFNDYGVSGNYRRMPEFVVVPLG